MSQDTIESLRARVAELERPDFRQMREMLRAMQAGELTVSRGIEILDMWHAGNWNDDMLPPVRQDLIEEDSMPVEIIDRLRARVAELEERLIPLRIEFEPGYPEDVAFGTQRQMDRLRKWLEKFYGLNRQLAAQSLTIKTMRDFVNQFLDENDTTDFGCSCDPGVGYTCGQCRTFVRQEPLRKAIATLDNSTEILQEWLAKQLGEPVGCEWQPIETAPITCNSLLIRRNGEICIANWGDYDEVNQPKFTHWMPLPHPPEIK